MQPTTTSADSTSGRGEPASMDRDRPSLPHSVFGVIRQRNTYAGLLYVLVSFPITLATFVAFVTLISTGGGLAITIAGIPLLVATMYLWCATAEVERVLANNMLGSEIRPLPFAGEKGPLWSLARIRTRLGNWYTWRALAFVLLRFGVATAGACVVLGTLGLSLQMMAAPIVYGPADGIDFMVWDIDRLQEALLLAAAGALFVIPSLHVSRLTAWLMGRFNELLLQSPEGARTPGGPGSVEEAAAAALLWNGIGHARRAKDTHIATIQTRAWAAHVAMYAATMVVLVFIDGASAGTWWVLYPAWGWGIAVALHTGYYLGGHLGGHAAAYLVAIIGLFVIDSLYTDRTWFYWPALGWGLIVAAHAYAIWGFTRVEAEPVLIRRASPPGLAPTVETPEAGIVVDGPMRTVAIDGQPIEVTPTEFALLALFTGAPGRAFSRDELLDLVWKDDFEITHRTVDTHIQRLRKKLGERADTIQTVWGMGYRYQP